tara:strand:+ start:105 stop:542 length:438 start_codon:yes stop_codon:yes gene_type:complete
LGLKKSGKFFEIFGGEFNNIDVIKITQLINDLEVLAAGWEKHAPNHTFSGYSLEQLRALILALKELLAAMDALKLEYRGKIASRQSMASELRDIRLRIVNCIRGHEDFGEDSEFYRFLGFKTKSERRSGLTRKIKVAPDNYDAAA